MSKQNVVIIAIAFLLLVGVTYAYLLYVGDSADKTAIEDQTGSQSNTEEPQIIGGDKDEGGCLVGAGFSWCEAKQKCLRVWEEPCTDVDALRNFLKDKISELSPEKEVLGGKFYLTNVTETAPGQALIEYEDGHIALKANVDYAVSADGTVQIGKFEIVKDESGEAPSYPDITADLAALFAGKYKKDASTIEITIAMRDATHARGGVKFAPEGAGGNFLAAVVDGQWQLVFDGNGSIKCQDLAGYGFTGEMLKDFCY